MLFLFQATTFNFGSLMAARIALGVFEAGFGPAIPLYFCKSSSHNRLEEKQDS